jgi:hypothetical protein
MNSTPQYCPPHLVTFEELVRYIVGKALLGVASVGYGAAIKDLRTKRRGETPLERLAIGERSRSSISLGTRQETDRRGICKVTRMKDTSRLYYEVIAVNERTGDRQSLGIGRDVQAHFLS